MLIARDATFMLLRIHGRKYTRKGARGKSERDGTRKRIRPFPVARLGRAL
jgi:hypothetical protein